MIVGLTGLKIRKEPVNSGKDEEGTEEYCVCWKAKRKGDGSVHYLL
jgi:hypothetical protein